MTILTDIKSRLRGVLAGLCLIGLLLASWALLALAGKGKP